MKDWNIPLLLGVALILLKAKTEWMTFLSITQVYVIGFSLVALGLFFHFRRRRKP